MPAPNILINTQTLLEPLLNEIKQHDTVAVDTEADNMHHYRERLCLVQIGIGVRVWLIDPLSPELNLRSLLEVLQTRRMLMHGADFDLRLLHRHHGPFRPARVFDTMLAAQLLGHAQVGLAALAAGFCEVTLVKKWQRADWSQRPLKEEMLAYAADDVRYLAKIHRMMRKQLQDKGRLAWHQQTCRRMIDSAQMPAMEITDPWRIKGGRHFRKRAAALLRELWIWRENIAEHNDQPPFKVASSDFLLQWPRWIEENPGSGFGDAPERPKWLRGSRHRSFECALKKALGLKTHQWPIIPKYPAKPPPRGSYQDEELLKKMVAERDRQAGDLDIDPGVLASRLSLKILARERPMNQQLLRKTSDLMPWQFDCLKQPLLKLIHDHVRNNAT